MYPSYPGSQQPGSYQPRQPMQNPSGYPSGGGGGNPYNNPYQNPNQGNPGQSYNPYQNPGQPGGQGSYNPYQNPNQGQGQPQGGYPGYGQPQQPQAPDLMSWFRSVDKDNSGKISAQELQRALVNGNYTNFSTEACRLLIGMFDKDKTGTIDYQEFQHLFQYVNQWKTTFEMYDRDKSASIEKPELEHAFQQMGYRFSPGFFDILIAKFDPEKKRNITFDNFIVACVQIHNLTAAFRVRDKEMKGVITIGYEDFVQVALGSSM